jgi:hypothetical protein
MSPRGRVVGLRSSAQFAAGEFLHAAGQIEREYFMRILVEHRKATSARDEHSVSQILVDWESSKRWAIGPTRPLEQHCILRAKRYINWKRTFALRNLPFQQYVRIEATASAPYVFEQRKPTHPRWPNRVSFTRSVTADKSETALQGEVLTFERMDLSLCADLVAQEHLVIGGLFWKDFKNIRVVTDKDILHNFAAFIPEQQLKKFRTEFFEGWDNASSFVWLAP